MYRILPRILQPEFPAAPAATGRGDLQPMHTRSRQTHETLGPPGWSVDSRNLGEPGRSADGDLAAAVKVAA